MYAFINMLITRVQNRSPDMILTAFVGHTCFNKCHISKRLGLYISKNNRCPYEFNGFPMFSFQKPKSKKPKTPKIKNQKIQKLQKSKNPNFGNFQKSKKPKFGDLPRAGSLPPSSILRQDTDVFPRQRDSDTSAKQRVRLLN